jgi:hypothetical protein
VRDPPRRRENQVAMAHQAAAFPFVARTTICREIYRVGRAVGPTCVGAAALLGASAARSFQSATRAGQVRKSGAAHHPGCITQRGEAVPVAEGRPIATLATQVTSINRTPSARQTVTREMLLRIAFPSGARMRPISMWRSSWRSRQPLRRIRVPARRTPRVTRLSGGRVGSAPCRSSSTS